jgi:hypothetical protein
MHYGNEWPNEKQAREWGLQETLNEPGRVGPD